MRKHTRSHRIFGQKKAEYLRVNICESKARGGLPSHHAAKSGFAFDDAVGYTHLSAKRWQVQDDLKHANDQPIALNCNTT